LCLQRAPKEKTLEERLELALIRARKRWPNMITDFRVCFLTTFCVYILCVLQIEIKELPANFDTEFNDMKRLICDCGKHHGKLHTHYDGKVRTSVYVPKRDRVLFCVYIFMIFSFCS
jgi:hypothetical protein